VVEWRGKMNKRREFLKVGVGFLANAYFSFGSFFSAVRWVYAKGEKTILPKGTKRDSLMNKDPKSLDTRNLETTPLKDFGTMGISDYEVNPRAWRLEVDGCVKKPSRLTYQEILSLLAIEKSVLLICPGFFANHGRWKGISMKDLLEIAVVESEVQRVTFSGSKGPYEKVARFPIEDVLANKVFLAYGVNGEILPKRHGFPLRVVGEDSYGNDWVKYVYKMTLDKI
jgi:DMSO/TMAO reductase YedYZ molybdopterin-dependent catalytic subunit